MADETIASSALKKLREIDEQLDELYQSAEAIKRLEQEFNSLYDRTEQQHQELLQDHDTAFAGCEKKHEALYRDFANRLKQLETQKSSLDREIHQLTKQKDELNSVIESLIKGYQSRQKQIDDAISQLSTQQTDLLTLEHKLIKAFSGLDDIIDTKLTIYENKLDAGVLESQTRIDQILDREIRGFHNKSSNLQKDIDIKVNDFDTNFQQALQQLNLIVNQLQSDFRILVDKFNVDFAESQEEAKEALDHEINDFYNLKENLKQEASTQFESINTDLLVFRSEIQQQLNVQEVRLNTFLERHIEDNKKNIVSLKNNLEITLKHAFSQIEEALTHKIDNKLYKVEQDQIRFIERQTVLIDNNTQQIDQLQRALTIEHQKIKQSINDLRDEVIKKNNKASWFHFGR